MSTSRTITTTTHKSLTAGPSRSRPIPTLPIDLTTHDEEDLEEEDEDDIIRKAQEQVERVRARKAAKKAARAVAAREKVAQEARERALRACQQEEEVVERRRLLAGAGTARSQRGTSPSEMSASPRRPVVEIRRKTTSKEKGKAKAQPVGGDPDNGDDGDNDDDDEEDRAPCEQCKNKKLPCQMQAGKRSSIICKPCHDAKVRCSYSGCPTTSKQREGGSGKRIAIMESQMAQSLADLRALQEADSKTHQYLRQLLRKQEDDHARLIAIETRMAMMGMGGGSAAGPSRQTTERWHPLKQQRVVEGSDEDDEEEKCHALTTTNQPQHHPTCFLTPLQDIPEVVHTSPRQGHGYYAPPQDSTMGNTHLPKTILTTSRHAYETP
ncbi:hypothetical protein GG344DRAFT_83388 [Lentinula edodes]|nr:hypothetical protein GG344DRAFT_83388 [Lentinula edodes]